MPKCLRRMCSSTLSGATLIGISLLALCFLMLATPAFALEDQAVSQSLPVYIDESIPDDATLVSTEYALLASGELVSVSDGSVVTDAELVGTEDTPPDPMALAGATRFECMTVGEAREQMEEAGISLLSLENSDYGAYWGTSSNTPAFFMGDGTMFVCQAKGVVDVSEHNGSIDWEAAKNAGVEGAIIRIGFGTDRADYYAQRNISECKRLGIPFGVYLYSYAEGSAITGAEEGDFTVSLLQQLGVSPDDLSLPVYYDLEQWTWTGHTPPTSSGTYTTIVSQWFSKVQGAGYSNAAVYSYTSYLEGPLNSSYIHKRTNWVAHYASKITYSDFQTVFRGWQYTESGYVNGIGTCDLNAFGNSTYIKGGDNWLSKDTTPDVESFEAVSLPNGTYYIDSLLKDSSSIGLSTTGSTQLEGYDKSTGQQFVLTRQSDGSYAIASAEDTSMVLDVTSGDAKDKAVVRLYEFNGTDAQRWWIRQSDAGYYIQSALGNWVLDIANGSSTDGTSITLYTPNDTNAQKFVLASAAVSVPTDCAITINSGVTASYVVDIANGSISNGARCQLYTANNTDAQAFWAVEVGNGLYEFVNEKSGRLMEVSSGYTANGSQVAQYDRNGTVSQHWALIDQGNSRYSLVGMKSGKALDVPSGVASNGAGLQIYTINSTDAQCWTFTETVTDADRMDSLATEHRADLADGTYLVSTSQALSKVLDVANGSSANAANVQLYTCNDTNAQRWEVSHDSEGYVTLTNVGSGKVLDVYSGVKSSGTNVQQYSSNGSDAQKWVAVKNSDGSYVLRSKLGSSLVLDCVSGGYSNATSIQVYEANGSMAQAFIFTDLEQGSAIDALAKACSSVVADGAYRISSAKSDGKVIDVANGSTANGANVQLYEWNSTNAQRWEVAHDEDGYLTITNVGSGKVLDVDSGVAASGRNIWQYSSNSTSAQKWIAVKEGGSIVLYSALGGGYVLDIASGSTSNGANVQLYAANDTLAQKFVFGSLG